MCRHITYTNASSELLFISEEHSLYGSARIGVDGRKDTLYKAGAYNPACCGTQSARRELGRKQYELTNHLGNVLVSLSDKKAYKTLSGSIFFEAVITTLSDYYPFGSAMQTRMFSAVGYRFGFNGKEKDDETYEGSLAFEARIFDARLGRFLSLDPRMSEYAWQTPFAYFRNSPVFVMDIAGMGGPYKEEETVELTNEYILAKSIVNSRSTDPSGETVLSQLENQKYSGRSEGWHDIRKGQAETQISKEKDALTLFNVPPIYVGKPTLGSEIKLKKIGESYCTNIYYDETYLYNFRIVHIEASIGLSIPIVDKKGKQLTVTDAKDMVADVVSKARGSTWVVWAHGKKDGFELPNHFSLDVQGWSMVKLDWAVVTRHSINGAPITRLDYL